LSIHLALEGIGISVINARVQELAYASFRGLDFRYTETPLNRSLNASIKWIQIDNQLFGGIFPIVLYPTVIPRDGKELEVHPNLQASVNLLKDQGAFYPTWQFREVSR
jgi:vacuolar protein sorting-associated protein 13A/C